MERSTKHIAIVEDDEGMNLAMVRLLQAAGFQTTTFSSAEAFLRQDAPLEVACVIVDIHLPGLSGLELGRRLHQKGPVPRVVFITAHDDPATRALALDVGGCAYLTKPFHGRSLMAAIEGASH